MKNESRPNEALAQALVEGVLAKLGFASRPAADLERLAALYGAWCRSVPFDTQDVPMPPPPGCSAALTSAR